MRFFAILFAVLTLAACQSAPYGPAIETGSVTPAAGQTSPAAATADEYRLGSGDKLRIIVFDEESLSGEFLVDGSGLVSMPLVGEITAAGSTVREFQRALEVALADGYLNDPKVSAEVLNFRPFYILGEVNMPGTYPFTDGLTVLNAVATAQGFTYRANRRVVYIRRDGETDERQYQLNSVTEVNPGDTIRIAERIF